MSSPKELLEWMNFEGAATTVEVRRVEGLTVEKTYFFFTGVSLGCHVALTLNRVG